jgi:hypothetical protein
MSAEHMSATVRRVTIAVVWLLALAAPLVGCRATPQATPGPRGPVDRSLLTRDPCEPPCWQGLTPGVSTQEEVLEYIAESDYVGDHYREPHAFGTTIWWQSTLRGRGVDTSSFFATKSGTLAVMMIYLDYEVAVKDLLAKHGPPEKLWAQWSTGDSGVAFVNLYYPTQGFMTQLEVTPSDGYHEVLPQTKVARVWYFPPGSLEGLPSLRFFIPFPPREYMDAELEDWRGYGRIRVT